MMIKEKGLVLGRSILLLEEIRVPGEYPPTCRKSLTKFNICIEYTSSWAWFRLTTYSDFFIQQILPCKCNFSGFYAKSRIQLEQAYLLDRKYLLQSDVAVRA